MRTHLWCVVVATLVLAACGDNSNEGAECGPGTRLDNGFCVPDGSVICEQGTVFDAESGRCVVDPSACGAGTVLIGGECVPQDESLVADHNEAAEPNDSAGAGQFAVPAIGEDVTIHGCITPRAGARDEDVWVMTTNAPAAVEITADGVGGLAAGFIVQDSAIPSLPTYLRYGINLTGDTSRRQVFLPVAGTYLLVMDDSRALLVNETAGGEGTCYYTTIKHIALPAATALTVPTETGNDTGNIRVLTHTADGEGDILRTVLATTHPSLSPAFVVMRGGTLVASTGPVAATGTAAAVPPQWTEGGRTNGDVLTIVVDHQYNFSPNPAPYTLSSLDLSAQAVPTNNTTVTVTGKRNGTDGATDVTKLSYLYFDVPANGTLFRWNLTASIPLDMFIVRKNIMTNNSFQVFAIIDAPGGANPAGRTTFNNEHTRFLTAGRYYLIVQNPLATATAGETFTVTSALTAVTPAALTYGVAATGETLPASGAAFYSIDFTNPTWVEFAATASNWGAGNVRVSAFDVAGEGWLGANYAAAFTGDQPVAGTAPFGRIMIGDTRDFIVRVTSTATPGASAAFDLAIRDRPHTAITVTPGTPIVRNGETLRGSSSAATAPNVTRYLVTGPAAATLSATVTPTSTSNVIIRRRGVDESSVQAVDSGADGAPEMLSYPFAPGPNNYVAFTVGDSNASDTTFDLAIAATPPPYTQTSGALAYTDACTLGTTVATNLDDTLTSAIALPAGFASFPFFGTATAGQIKISSNGWLTFDTAATANGANTAYPNAQAPNALVSPYAEDLVGITICTRSVGNTFVVQWTGYIYNTPTEVAQFQAVLHTSGVIDFIYGSGHTLNGSEPETGMTTGATIGLENQTGTVAFLVGFNQNVIAPATSRTFTPN